MKVQLIGTGCIGTKQNSAASVINKKILLDVPNGICRVLRNMNISLTYIQTVIITHYHGDHFFDLPFLILEKSFIKTEKPQSLNIIGPKDIEIKTIELFETAFPNSWEKVSEIVKINFVEILPGETKYIEDTTIEAVKVEHILPEAQGYILTIDNQRCGFTGDSSECEGIEYILSKTQILIADCANIIGGKTHMGIDNIKKYLEKYPEKVIIATHMKEDTRKEAEKIESENFIIPSDGYTIDF